MKIAIASTWKAACGISTYSSYLIDEVKKTNEVMVLAEDRDVSGKDDTQKVDVPYVECWSRHGGFDGMISEIKKFGADLVHIQYEFGLFGLSPPFMHKFIETCKKISVPKVITYHSIPLASPEFFLPYFRNSDNLFRKKIIHSETGLAAATKIYGLTNGVHINHGTSTYKTFLTKDVACSVLGIPKDNKVLMSMGYFGGLKGVSELIDLFAEFRKKYPNSTFIYAGGLHLPTAKWGKKYMADCMKKIMNLGMTPKDFMITGYVPEDELLKYYSAADVYLLNYLSSGYISASGCSAKLIGTGRPIVTTGGTYRNEELTGGKNCIKVEAGNTGAMLSATIQILEDKPKYDSIVSEGMKYANDNSWENIANNHVKLYEEVIK